MLAVTELYHNAHAADATMNSELEKVKGVYKGSAIRAIVENLAAYELSALDMRTALKRISDAIFAAAHHGELSEWIDDIDLSLRALRLATSPYIEKGGKYWKLQVYPMAEGEAHPPHGHHNLASFLCVLDGKVMVREYDRVEMVGKKRIKLRFRGERIIGPGEAMITPSETEGNIHWFGSLTPSATCINFNARGYFSETFFASGKNGRRYCDPLSTIAPDGTVIANVISRKKAKLKFENSPIESHQLSFAA